jgi:hypothetical protein
LPHIWRMHTRKHIKRGFIAAHKIMTGRSDCQIQEVRIIYLKEVKISMSFCSTTVNFFWLSGTFYVLY